MDSVKIELCRIGTILQMNYRKMTITWSFSYNSVVKFHGKKDWEPQYDHIISESELFVCLI